jgi:hypothetical protein
MSDVPPTDSEGGKGGESAPAGDNLGPNDVRLIARAIVKRWPIPDEKRPAIIGALVKLALNERAAHRNRLGAVRGILAADALNMEQEKRDQGGDTLNVNLAGGVQHDHVHQIPDPAALVARLIPYADALRAVLGVRGGAPGSNGAAKPLDSPPAAPETGALPRA